MEPFDEPQSLLHLWNIGLVGSTVGPQRNGYLSYYVMDILFYPFVFNLVHLNESSVTQLF